MENRTVNLYLSILFYYRMVLFFLIFFFFFDGVTVNPNITKQEDTAFFAKKVGLLLARITTCKYSVCLQAQA